MPLSQADRIAFSLQIVSSATKISALTKAKDQTNELLVKTQAIDTANKNLFDPVNVLAAAYEIESQHLDGKVRTGITEQNIQDSANKKLNNFFFPNNTTITVPSLSAFNNIWTKISPFALTVAIGKSYVETYGSATKEGDLINAVLALITSGNVYADIEKTSGQKAIAGVAAHCSNPIYLNQATCEANGGTWIGATFDQVVSYPEVITLKSDLVTAVNNLITFLNTEVASIVTNDSNTTRQSQNNTAIANINSTFLPALNTWLGYPDFNPVPGSVDTYAEFYSYNAALLAPTKLHSAQLTALTNALNSRLSFITTRLSQLGTNLGSITQDVNNGAITASSGLYGLRYSFLVLRLGALDGSLTQLAGLTVTKNAQESIIESTKTNTATYQTIVPTSAFKADANGTAVIHLLSTDAFSPGDTVFISAEEQPELQRAIKSINNGAVTLNDLVPAKYRASELARMYKDNS